MKVKTPRQTDISLVGGGGGVMRVQIHFIIKLLFLFFNFSSKTIK